MIKDSQDQNINHLKCLVVYSMAKQKQKQKQNKTKQKFEYSSRFINSSINNYN